MFFAEYPDKEWHRIW